MKTPTAHTYDRRARLVGLLGLFALALLSIGSIDAAAQTTTTTTTSPAGSGNVIGALWESYTVFVTLIVLTFTAIGAWSKSLTVGAFSGYLAFLYLALEGGNQMFRNIAMVTLVLTFLGMAFKVVRLEFEGDA